MYAYNICLYLYISISVFVFISLSISVSIYLPIYLSIYLPIYLSIYLPIEKLLTGQVETESKNEQHERWYRRMCMGFCH